MVGIFDRIHTCAHAQISTDVSHFYPGGYVTVTVTCQVSSGRSVRSGDPRRHDGRERRRLLRSTRIGRSPEMGRTCLRSRSSEEGSISAFVVLMLVAVFVLMGLVVDGGSALSARQSATDEAEQAARAGAGALSVSALRSGVVQIDQQQAIEAAEEFTVAAGHPGTASVSSGTVTVQIHYRIRTEILGIIGPQHLAGLGVCVGGRRRRGDGGIVMREGIVPRDHARLPASPGRRCAAVALALIVVVVPFGLYELGGLPFAHLSLRAGREGRSRIVRPVRAWSRTGCCAVRCFWPGSLGRG